MSERLPIVLGLTGASGAPYAVSLLRELLKAERNVSLIISRFGWRLLRTESGIGDIAALQESTGAQAWTKFVRVHENDDRGAQPASGSWPTAGMVICPCSMGTLSAVSVGASRSLIERAADVTLKERRKLILVPRETPMSAIHLENMLRLVRAGAVVMPAAPGYYNKPQSIQDLVDFMVARILDHLDVEHAVGKRWAGE
ncbi:MAG: UbiX family flavin prenyltransferase [Gemmatimonadaceae bacterium]|nr:UbiX family flavin prenyltransferase [Gemmatimonadaceae bacterium]